MYWFLHSITLSEYRMEKNIDKDPLVVKQNNYASEIVNFTLSMI